MFFSGIWLSSERLVILQLKIQKKLCNCLSLTAFYVYVGLEKCLVWSGTTESFLFISVVEAKFWDQAGKYEELV